MTMPFGYASPEQQFRDKSEYARKGIARGRSVVVLTCSDGILFVAENPSPTLHKISEIYDRIAFAAVGRYNEFDNLRSGGIRFMDMRGYMYDRKDVTGRALANVYSQTLGTIFTESIKPYEVEIVVAEAGTGPETDQIYRLTYDGSIADEQGSVAIGGQSEQVNTSLRSNHSAAATLAEALKVAVNALKAGTPATGGPVGGGVGANNGERTLTAANLEVAILDRNRTRRLFRRIVGNQLDTLLADPPPAAAPAADPPAGDPPPGDAPAIESAD